MNNYHNTRYHPIFTIDDCKIYYHLSDEDIEFPPRRVRRILLRCPYCHSEMNFEEFKHHHKKCNREYRKCNYYKCSMKVENESEHLKKCNKRK